MFSRMTIRTSNCVAWGVDDISEASDFYTKTLGFREVQRGDGWIEMETGALRVFLTKDDGTTPTFDLQAEDVQAAAAALLASGFTKLGEANGEVYVRDPYCTNFAISHKAC
jgi:catechol 2,3-dioxygenase-like lactoylglutathione lyase family enzyme